MADAESFSQPLIKLYIWLIRPIIFLLGIYLLYSYDYIYLGSTIIILFTLFNTILDFLKIDLPFIVSSRDRRLIIRFVIIGLSALVFYDPDILNRYSSIFSFLIIIIILSLIVFISLGISAYLSVPATNWFRGISFIRPGTHQESLRAFGRNPLVFIGGFLIIFFGLIALLFGC